MTSSCIEHVHPPQHGRTKIPVVVMNDRLAPPFVPCQSAVPFLRWGYFKSWHWIFKVKAMVVVKVQDRIIGPVSNWFSCFLFHINQTKNSCDTTISKSDPEESKAKVMSEVKGRSHMISRRRLAAPVDRESVPLFSVPETQGRRWCVLNDTRCRYDKRIVLGYMVITWFTWSWLRHGQHTLMRCLARFTVDARRQDEQAESYLFCKVNVVIRSWLITSNNSKLYEPVWNRPATILTCHWLHFARSRTRK